MDKITRITLIISSLLYLVVTDGYAQVKRSDGIAAVVNDQVITYSEVRKLVENREKDLRNRYASDEEFARLVEEARLKTLRSLIERELIIQDFHEKGFFLPDNVIEDEYQRRITQRWGGDRKQFIRTLQAMGQTVSEFKQGIREEMIVGSMRSQNVQSSVIISPYQIEQHYQENIREFLQPEQIKLRMILLRKGLFTEKRKDPITGEMQAVDPQFLIAKELLQKIQTGSDFASLAKAYSDLPTKSKGGAVGWLTEDTLRKELSQVAFSLRPGQNSDIIKTPEGYYILQVEDLRKARVTPLAEVREYIERELENSEKSRLEQEWLDSLRAKAYIKMFF
ncbi:MAG: peptidylprolyl isomerase [Verrucomicrobiota bacterium]